MPTDHLRCGAYQLSLPAINDEDSCFLDRKYGNHDEHNREPLTQVSTGVYRLAANVRAAPALPIPKGVCYAARAWFSHTGRAHPPPVGGVSFVVLPRSGFEREPPYHYVNELHGQYTKPS